MSFMYLTGAPDVLEDRFLSETLNESHNLLDFNASPIDETDLHQSDTLQKTDVMHWDGQDCINWVTSICYSNNIDPTCINISLFGSLTGEILTCLTAFDFYCIDAKYGHIFYQEFQNLLGHTGIALTCVSPNDTIEVKSEMNIQSLDDCHSYEGYQLTDISMEVPLDIESLHSFAKSLADPSQELMSEFQDGPQNDHQKNIQFSEENRYVDDYGYDSDSSRLHSVPSSPCLSDIVNSPESFQDGDDERKDSCSPFARVPSPSPSTDGKDVLEKIKTTSRKRVRGPKNWEYLMRLLNDTAYNPSIIRWEDEDQDTFRIIKPNAVAKIWGERSNKPNLTYDNFARGLRYHYKTGALKAVSERQLVYKCGPRAKQYLRNMKYS